MNNMKTYVLQLKHDQDLKKELEKFTTIHNIKAGYILTGIGNLTKATLRFVDEKIKSFDENFAINSINGTLSLSGIHVHVSISNKDGVTFGGHLKEGCIIYHSAEIVIGESDNFTFSREFDVKTGFNELQVKNNGF